MVKPSHFLQDIPRPLEYFVDRQVELEQIKAWGQHTRHGRMPLLIVGPPGIGKTALAIAYAHASSDFYSKQIFLQARSFESHDAIVPFVNQEIGSFSDKPVLAILDGLDEISLFETSLGDVLFSITQSQNRTRWLITLRSLQYRMSLTKPTEIITPSFDFHSLHLSGLNRFGIDELLKKRLKYTFDLGPKLSDFYQQMAQERLSGNANLINVLLDLANSNAKNVNRTIQDILSENYTNLLLLFREGRVAAVPANRFPTHDIITPSQNRLTVAPYIFLPRVSIFWRRQLDEFEDLLNDENTKEEQFQSFFKRNPDFLLGFHYIRFISKPVLEREPSEGNLIPDFILAPIGKSYADILDLKMPKEKIIVGSKDRKRFSAAVHEAIAQVRGYRDFFEDERHRKRVKERYGLTAYRPSAIVIIGREPNEISEEKFKQIEETKPEFVKITTYDQLFRQMKRFADYQS